MSRTKLVILLNVIIVLGPNHSQGAIARSRETAITQAIKKVGPAVASINVLHKISLYPASDPIFRYFFPPEIYLEFFEIIYLNRIKYLQ